MAIPRRPVSSPNTSWISRRSLRIKTLRGNGLGRELHRNLDLYLLSIPALTYFIVFHYLPMYGVQIAFKEFIAVRGIAGSPWIGFLHFERFFRSHNFWRLIRNTVGISIYSLAVGFPFPIILALMLNEVLHARFKKVVQLITYAPHFISVVVIVGMLLVFLSPTTGLLNIARSALGLDRVAYLARPEWFQTIYVFSGLWQSAGWASIIYVASLSSINPELQEAAIIDGASRMQKIWHINIPGIAPTIIILLILNLGRVMSVGFEKVFLMQNALNISASEVIATYVYRVGLLGAQFSFSAAVGLFNAVINLVLLASVNSIAGRLGETSLW